MEYIKNNKILERLKDVPAEKRTARFVCAVAAVFPGNEEVIGYGTMEGRIADHIAGKNGCEMVKEVIRSAGLIMEEIPDEMYLDKSPEYWAGWALAYYQWYTARPFMKIYKVVTIEDLLKMYSVYHEMDIMKFVEAINEKWDQYYTETNLKRLRKIAGLSQRELADLSGVALRQIQLFEQKKRNINHTRAIDVLKIGKVLGCKSEDLLEI